MAGLPRQLLCIFAVEFLDMHRIEPLDPTVLALCVPLPSLESESHI